MQVGREFVLIHALKFTSHPAAYEASEKVTPSELYTH